ncbi:MAG: DUF721 domain-containing protein [Geminicoccaceae bacterium]
MTKRRGRSTGGLRRIPDLLGRVLDPAAKRRGIAEARLLTDWAKIIGSEIAAQCQPISLSRDGLLQIHVSGSAALELQHSELQVIERINTFFGRPTVTRLRLRQAPHQRRPLAPLRSVSPERPLSTDEQAAIDQAIDPVGDPALREALAALGTTLKRRRSNRGGNDI